MKFRFWGKPPEPMYGERLLRFLDGFLRRRLKGGPRTMQELGEEAFALVPPPNDIREAVYLLIRVWQSKGGVDVDIDGVKWRRSVKVNLDKLATFPSSLRRYILDNWAVPGYTEQIDALLREV